MSKKRALARAFPNTEGQLDELSQSDSGSSDARPEKTELPSWYRELAAGLDPARVPDLQAGEDQALFAGWSGAVLQSAARVYLRKYCNQRVTDPFALFQKLAIQEASRLPSPEPQRQASTPTSTGDTGDDLETPIADRMGARREEEQIWERRQPR